MGNDWRKKAINTVRVVMKVMWGLITASTVVPVFTVTMFSVPMYVLGTV